MTHLELSLSGNVPRNYDLSYLYEDDEGLEDQRINRAASRLIGAKFGRLSIVKLDRVSNSKVWWETLCECGEKRSVVMFRLQSGEVKECKSCSGGTKRAIEPVVRWKFSAPKQKIKSVLELLSAGSKTVYEIHKGVKGTLDSTMDCLSVLVDQGRIDVSYTPDEERLYSLKKAKTYSSHASAEVDFLQISNS